MNAGVTEQGIHVHQSQGFRVCTSLGGEHRFYSTRGVMCNAGGGGYADRELKIWLGELLVAG